MIDIPPTAFEHWSRTMFDMLAWQWQMLETNCQAGLTLMESVLTFPGNQGVEGGEEGKSMPEIVMLPIPENPSAMKIGDPERVRVLERSARDLANQGLMPPKEIYASPYRDRIDWLLFPAWARPSDPELFQDCGHEG